MEISTLAQFEAFLKTRVPSREALFVGDLGLRRAEYFMRLLGNPQDKIKVIHIAGTSGKGSTAHLISRILESQGFKTGLSISPHVFDIRERMQISSKLPDEKTVLEYFNRMLPIIREMESCSYGAPTFFEINVALAYLMFAGEGLDYAVMETGLGGLLDATNTVTAKNKICVITKLGLDHTEILGKTISKIAQQKAGIIQDGNAVISIRQTAAARAVIKKRCADKNASLHFAGKQHYSIVSSTSVETVFDFKFDDLVLKNINLRLIGLHQAENCSLALACLTLLSKRDNFEVDEKKLREALAKIAIPGRCEIRNLNGKKLVIDGAHNPQKMEAFTSNLSRIFPDQKFTFVVAFKKSKDFEEMLEKIMPLADRIFLTHFSTSNMDNHWSSVDNATIADFLESRDFRKYAVIGNEQSDILHAIQESENPAIITGSLYLIGKVSNFIR